MGFAFILSLCSTSDAFIASTLNMFSKASRLAFLVFGPMVDVKLIFMYSSVFRSRFVARRWLDSSSSSDYFASPGDSTDRSILMTRQRIFYFCGTLVLLFWGAVLVYFYHSGRLGDTWASARSRWACCWAATGLWRSGRSTWRPSWSTSPGGGIRSVRRTPDAAHTGTSTRAGTSMRCREGEQERAHDHTHFAGEESVFGGIGEHGGPRGSPVPALATASDAPSANAVEQMGVFLSSDDLFSEGEAEMMFRNHRSSRT